MATLKETIELFQGENCYGILEVEFEFDYDASNEEFTLEGVTTLYGDAIADRNACLLCSVYFIDHQTNNPQFQIRLDEAWEISQ